MLGDSRFTGAAGLRWIETSLPSSGSAMSFVRPRRLLVPAALVALSAALAGCGNGSSLNDADPGSQDGLHDSLGSSPSSPAAAVAVVHSNVRRGATDVPVDRR